MFNQRGVNWGQPPSLLSEGFWHIDVDGYFMIIIVFKATIITNGCTAIFP